MIRDVILFVVFISKPTGLLRGHTAPIFHLFICPEDDRIFSISTDKTVKVWRFPLTLCDHHVSTLEQFSLQFRKTKNQVIQQPIGMKVDIIISQLELQVKTAGKEAGKARKRE